MDTERKLMVFLVTTLFLIAYGINIVLMSIAAIGSDHVKIRRNAVISIFVCLLAVVGVIYLAAN
jgi:uncharacterized membrane protein YidH (DUF202 family)